jgi:hypothetical protein
VRATLHEELMREAGFEVERDVDRRRMREERRRAAQVRAYRVLRAISVIAGAIAFVEWVAGLVIFATRGVDSHATHVLFVAGFGVATVAVAADALLRWTPLGGDAAGRSRRPRRGLASWFFGRDLVEIVAWIRGRLRRRKEVA